MTKKPFFLAVCLAFCIAGYPSFGIDLPLEKIIDDSALRRELKDSLFSESPGRVMARPRTLRNLDGGGRVELRIEAGQDEFAVVIARELYRGRVGEENTATGQFPGWAQGSWVLTRRKDTGTVTQIRVFLRSDPNTCIQFRPLSADKCQMDAVLYDAYVVRSLPLAVSLERIYTMPLAEVLNLAGDKFPRRYFEPNPADYREHRLFVSKVRERLPQLRFTDDGAIDQTGRYVYINTGLEQKGPSAQAPSAEVPMAEAPGLNCSGFAKWLIDGILRPATGERMAIPPLKAPFGDRGSSFTDSWEDLRDPFFGLDWIRNLASTAGRILRSPAFAALNEIEVRGEPFAQMILRGRNTSTVYSYPGFLDNAGYGVEGLVPLLYTLAIDEPGRFYLAAVNTETGPAATEANPRGRPRMRQYFHIMAFIPYFNEYGVFQITVFESAAETSITAFRNRYPPVERKIDGEFRIFSSGYHVNLVRIPLETAFDP